MTVAITAAATSLLVCMTSSPRDGDPPPAYAWRYRRAYKWQRAATPLERSCCDRAALAAFFPILDGNNERPGAGGMRPDNPMPQVVRITALAAARARGGASPESISPGCGYGFRARRLRAV